MKIQPTIFFFLAALVLMTSCKSKKTTEMNDIVPPVRLMVLDPGHFHAGLVQKIMYDNVDPEVAVFAPDGPDVENYLAQVEAYNHREKDPTNWIVNLHIGPDFFQKMLDTGDGNVLVLAGNNQKKTEYILGSVNAGINILSDKPMAIDADDFDRLKEAFKVAGEKHLLVYDIMTERYEITTILQKKFSQIPEVFGTLVEGSPDDPAVIKESIHHFYKYVSGNILKRPAWFFDVRQQGDGIVDVTTHLVDLVQWSCFPEQIVNYENDIQLISAHRWPTILTPGEFQAVTQLDRYPGYLQDDLNDSGQLEVYANGEINYRIKGIHAKVRVAWHFKAPEEGGDTHYSVMRGTRSNLVIRQGPEEAFIPTLYIEPAAGVDMGQLESGLTHATIELLNEYPELGLEITKNGWKITIPESYRVGHEAHFGQVTQAFLNYLEAGALPDWEVPNMLAKYYVTTQALDMAKENTE